MFTHRPIRQNPDEDGKKTEKDAKSKAEKEIITKGQDKAEKPEKTAKTVDAKEKASEPALAKPKRSGAVVSILIVEDEKPLAHALEMKLKNEGYDVTTATNGEDALVTMKKSRFGLVLLDLIMPHMDGFGVLTEMKDRKIKIPVIVLSNLGQDEDREKAKQLGAIDYFVKSNTPIAEIVARVKQVI